MSGGTTPTKQYSSRQSYGRDTISPTLDEKQQSRYTPTTNSSLHFPPGVRLSPSLSASSSPLHYAEHRSEDQRVLQQRQQGYSPMRNQDSHQLPPSSTSLPQYYMQQQQQQLRPRLRQHKNQHPVDRGGGIYYNIPPPPGRQSVMHPNYSQGKQFTYLIIILVFVESSKT